MMPTSWESAAQRGLPLEGTKEVLMTIGFLCVVFLFMVREGCRLQLSNLVEGNRDNLKSG